MQLSESNLAILRGVREGIMSRGHLLQLSQEELAEVHEQEADLDAQEYAEWAGQRLATMMRPKPWELIASKDWYFMKLREYLVKAGYIEHAFFCALKCAERLKHGEEERR